MYWKWWKGLKGPSFTIHLICSKKKNKQNQLYWTRLSRNNVLVRRGKFKQIKLLLWCGNMKHLGEPALLCPTQSMVSTHSPQQFQQLNGHISKFWDSLSLCHPHRKNCKFPKFISGSRLLKTVMRQSLLLTSSPERISGCNRWGSHLLLSGPSLE